MTTRKPVVRIARNGPVLWARINRPEAGNACNGAVMAGVDAALQQSASPDVKALVLTGTGTSFCAGADLAEGTALLDDQPALLAYLDKGRQMVRHLLSAPVPTIAAVNGAAYGGGFELLQACDIAVAGASARIGDRHLKVGQVPGWGSSAMLPRRIGAARARRLLLTAETWTASQAQEHGLISEVVPDAELESATQALAEQLASLDVAAVRRMLALVRDPGPDSAWNREWEVLVEHMGSQAGASAAATLARLRSH
ncbi:enoyl-CoA hydratase/isomerase family protein [Nocardioides alcanivorans]|uniref:enoyl-CoA hydratase/isomerase family protein n=1 Tax=Nocardioides alcanivorans TaxID=2897352 RepID=UPI001F46051A|nr:enoyl-CoA hydratase/isomerase family protein [Nocardioides alcanivorans]